ncbi:MAG: hypothetical protein PSV36_03965 [Algoriphagus sp.]|nr:hypothetical protein [Algoriphagus sp.]
MVSSCIEEENEQLAEPVNSEILAAKTWYESVEAQSTGNEKARKVKNGKGKPDWAKSKIYNQSDGKRVIEVQFDFEEISIPEHLKTEKLEKNSVLQTLILFPKPNGSYVSYFLNIFPDSPDKKFYTEDFIEGGYEKVPSDFSGVYRFYRWNGKFISGWRIKDGAKTHRLKNAKNNQTDKNSRISNGTVYCYQIITTWYTSTCYEGIGCTTPQEDGIDINGYECDYIAVPPSLSGEGDGGGGSSDGGDDCEQPEGNILDLPVDCEEEEVAEIVDDIENLIGQELNPCEILMVAKHLPVAYFVYQNSVDSHVKTIQLFGRYQNGNGRNDCADAFRHTYWNFLNVRLFGLGVSTDFANAHECDTPQDLLLEKEMDLYNNQRGRELGLIYGYGNGEAHDLVLNSLNNGGLKVLSPLDEGNLIIPGSTQMVSSSICN